MRGCTGWALLGAIVALAPPTEAQRRMTPAQTLAPLSSRLVSPTLERFDSEADFRSWLKDLKREAAKRERRWTRRAGAPQFAQTGTEPSCIKPEDCPTDDVVVTGSRVSKPNTAKPSNPSITNTQERGVDEGDIVKQIGQYLLILQDGRIFGVDTRPAGGGLALSDRIDVYRDKASGAWYDEMLVQGDRIVVTAYSYESDATELSVFRLSPGGRFERQGVFLLSSDDYYDSDNYATRLVGDSLVVYSPMRLEDVDPDKRIEWPVVRRWQPAGERMARGRALFDARRIYRPVQPTLDPVVHTVSICPLGPSGRGGDLNCRTTAIVGPSDRQFYVTPDDAWLWVTPGWSDYSPDNEDACDRWSRRAPARAHPAAVFRIDLRSGEPTVAAAEGLPIDQFSLGAARGQLHALVKREPILCDVKPQTERTTELALVTLPFASFTDTLPTRPAVFVPMPSAGATHFENRFTDTHLVYGGRKGWGSYPPGLYARDGDQPVSETSTAVAVPLRSPRQPVQIALPHNVIRIERVGDDIIATGYRDMAGLQLSVLDLRATPRLADTVLLPRRYESEGRSHAFNSSIGADGSGLLGLPTVMRKADSGRWWWRSDASDVSFLALDRSRRLRPIGELTATPNAVDPSYRCEVSCVDWYGNARPIFTDGRVFAVADAELVEGRVDGGKIVELRRLNLTQAPPRR